MPDTRGRPLPAEILSLLKDPSITSWLRTFLVNTSSAASIGRFPGNGSAQDDQYVYPDDADATYAYNFDYVVPANFQRLVSAKLSLKIRAFRTYNNFSATQTGDTTLGTDATGSSGHFHTIPIDQSAVAAANLNWNGPGTRFTTINNNAGGNTAAINGESGHSHSHNHGVHHHSVSITSTLGIFEDVAPVNPGITVKVDGVDVTTKVGGPFNNDQVEVDVTQVVATGVKLWHTLSLQPNQRVRITGILRLSYYVDSRLAQ